MRSTGIVSTALAGAIFLAGIDARAEPPTQEPPLRTTIIPQCKVYTLDDGREVCGWMTIDEIRAAYHADNELVLCRDKTAAQAGKLHALEVEAFSLRKAVQIEEEAKALVLKRNKELTDDLIEMNRKYEDERAKPRWGSPVAWATAAVLGAALLGYAGADLLD